eukprot:TRINITY_DN6839_c0_g1_i1.p1 TRINITY_DN6839_c0_g1~~TRINITY_DN6839_c0_g1_i1.p1  ORF type:complete len:305 (-),score=83.92 TRINITY_DN6839_c0_g1_i1:61-933(-)
MTSLSVKCFFEESSSTCQYVVADSATKKCAIVDSVLFYDAAAGCTSPAPCDEMLAYIKEQSFELQWILDTHAHADHITGAQYLKKLYPDIPYCIGEHIKTVQETFKPIYDLHELKTDGSQFDRLFKDGETFQLGDSKVVVMHTPGHTPACISYYFESGAVFVGDTLFAPDAGTGRCDFPNGSAHDMWTSLQKLCALPEETDVYLCHDYQPGGRELVYKTTVKAQKENNIHLADSDENKYIEFRKTRDATLKVPKLLIPSIQVNIDGGHLPTAKDGDKHAHLKVPLNVLGK